DLFDGLLDVKLGRQLEVDTLDWWSYDGASARVKTPWHVAAEVGGGLAVRESSPLASPTFELDGTSGGQCQEYVEGATPGEGQWQLPISDFAITNDPFRADLDEDWCKQRNKVMPTWGASVETTGLGWITARASYRRTMSKSVGPIHSGDPGYYPNEFGEQPDWGVNEEVAGGSVRGSLWMGRWDIAPYVEGRYSLLHGRIDQATLGSRVAWRGHALEPQLYYSFPTFDGDSIFNVFSAKAYYDARLRYEFAPARARWRAFASAWVREFHNEDTGDVESGSIVRDVAYSSGGQVGGAVRLGAERSARVDLFHELGYGGRRSGGMAALRWRLRPTLDATGRFSAFSFDEDLREDLDGVSYGGQAGATWRLNLEGVAVHMWFEENHSVLDHSQWRMIGILDLAFQPEVP
ncbi:MAG TPA: hypothetical protein VL172_01440, partial [Kofleriaceae bacterium]|nr:hypothetical protein [Kofleriaceae bacterium]